MPLNVQYGCGLSDPDGWKNFDSSPTLMLKKIPLVGLFIKKVDFSPRILYGDILKGLPKINSENCDAIYCSHVLEHLSLNDLRLALLNTFKLLKPGGVFRFVLPDLEYSIDHYTNRRNNGELDAANKFMYETMLGIENRPKSIKDKIIFLFGNSHHLWMWDKHTMNIELENTGFTYIRYCFFNDSLNLNFLNVEEKSRFENAIAFECIK